MRRRSSALASMHTGTEPHPRSTSNQDSHSLRKLLRDYNEQWLERPLPLQIMHSFFYNRMRRCLLRECFSEVIGIVDTDDLHAARNQIAKQMTNHIADSSSDETMRNWGPPQGGELHIPPSSASDPHNYNHRKGKLFPDRRRRPSAHVLFSSITVAEVNQSGSEGFLEHPR